MKNTSDLDPLRLSQPRLLRAGRGRASEAKAGWAAPAPGVFALAALALAALGGAEVLGGLGSAAVPELGQLDAARTLQAGALVGSALLSDYDGDGLEDAAEQILGTSNGDADTDHDGFVDSEELARDSDPLDIDTTPETSAPHAGLDASAHDGRLHLISTFYVETSEIPALSVQIGALIRNRLVFLAPRSLSNNVHTTIVPGATPGTSVVIVDTSFRPLIVHRLGDVSFATTLLRGGEVVGAETVNIAVVEGVLMRRFELPMVTTAAIVDSGGGPTSAQQGGGQGSTGAWSFYRPIVEDGGTQNSGTAGSVCVQKTQIVGAVGGAVTQEVVEADCQDGWDGFCGSSCASTVGNTYVSIDPGALIGG